MNAVLRKQPGTQRLLLFVDQWEELYTNCEKANRRERFVQELLEATSRKDSPLTVVLTVRGDFYNEILRDRPLLDLLQSGRLDLGPMNAAELRSAIAGPGKNVGLTFQDGLVDRILTEAGEEHGRLPLLEFALEELWKRRDGVQLTHAGYEDLGRQPGQKEEVTRADKGGPLIPTLPKNEGGNLVSALARVHRANPLKEAFEKRLADAKTDVERNRFFAVQLSLGIEDKAAVVCELKADPTSRTSLILGFKEFPGDLASVARLLETTSDSELRSALCVAIDKLAAECTDVTQPVLKRLFLEAPDGGTHSAADWALRQQGLSEAELLKLAQTARFGSADLQAKRDWDINNLNMTMLKIPAREFAMGPADDDKNPAVDAQPEQFAAFWLSDREVSVGQFYAVLKKPNQPADMNKSYCRKSWMR